MVPCLRRRPPRQRPTRRSSMFRTPPTSRTRASSTMPRSPSTTQSTRKSGRSSSSPEPAGAGPSVRRRFRHSRCDTRKMSFTTIDLEIADGIGWLTFNRPKALNAFDPVLIEETNRAIADLSADDRVQVIVVAGSGRAFSAGFDIKASAQAGERTTAEWREVLEADFDFIMQFWDCPKPSIAAVHGYCLGGA